MNVGEVMQRTCSGCHKSEFVTVCPPPPWARNKPPKPWYCHRCQHKANPHYQRIKALEMDTKSLIQAAKDSCGLAMRNTATGAWLAAMETHGGMEMETEMPGVMAMVTETP